MIRSPRPCYLPTLAMVCALAACGGDTTQPGGDGSPKSITGLWNASVSGIKGQTPGGQPTTCTASWVMSIDSFPENDPDPLVLAEKMREIEMTTVDQAHAWLTRLLVERYAEERITLDTGKFRMPTLSP